MLHANLSGVLKCIQSLSLPVKCSRLKLIVRANHLYRPLTKDRKKCDPMTLAAVVFHCEGKENILVCKALLPWTICLLALSPELCRTVFMYNTNSCIMMSLLFKWGNCLCFVEARARVRMVEQTVRRIPHLFSSALEMQWQHSLHKGIIYISCSSVCLSAIVWGGRLADYVDRAGTSIMQDPKTFLCLKDGKEEEEFHRWEKLSEEHLGTFIRNMKERLCWGAQSTERLCSLCIYKGHMNIWLMSHRLWGNAMALQSSPITNKQQRRPV